MDRPRKLLLVAGSTVAVMFLAGSLRAAQSRGASGLPALSGNPLAALQAQIDVLEQTLAGLVTERVLRGTVMEHEGFTTTGDGWTAQALGGGKYSVTFAQSFSAPPTVLLTIHGFPDQFSHTIAIDDGAGGSTTSGFHAYLSEGNHAANVADNFEFLVIGR